MAKEIRRYELALDTDDEEAGRMKARMRIEEAQRLRHEVRQTAPTSRGDNRQNGSTSEAR